MVQGVLNESNRRGKFILLHPVDQFTPSKAFNDVMDEVDGIILVDIFSSVYKKIEPELKALPKPIVVLNYEGLPVDIDSVVIDSGQTARAMVRFLVNNGHRRIAFVYQHSIRMFTHPNILNRIQGFQDGLQEHGLTLRPELMVEQKSNDDDILGKWWALPQRPTAVFCGDDQLALIMLRKAADRGIRIPDDLTIVGHDDLKESNQSRPPLTTTHVPLQEMGRLGVERLLEKFEERERGCITHSRKTLTCSIVERDSHRKL
jgi:DNA-binding LacI/PurR family transcriptional regulator